METPSAPVSHNDTAAPLPGRPIVVVPQDATLGTIATAMLIGALLAVSGLYFWGAEIAHNIELQEAGAASGSN